MSRLSSRSRMRSHESASLEKRLTLYSLAASAAGLSVFTLAQPAEAKIVYTPANISITQNGGLIPFDLNHDGISDFALSNIYTHTSFQATGFLKVVQAQSANEVWGVTSKGFLCAAALPKNVHVGPNGHFQKDPKAGLAMAFSNFEGTYFGPWRNVKQAFLGLKFVIKGKTHFGWARVKGNFNSRSITATLTGYAYETIPNKPIITGKTKGPDAVTVQPPSLGHLAAGASAIPVWRVKQTAANSH
jgi:hypothetical protein